MRSGTDTNLRGAQLTGDTVIADIGGDLNIQTVQDTSRYESDQKSSGVSVSLCIPPFCYGNVVTGSLSTAKEQIDHDFQSAKAQSGIAAGSGGFEYVGLVSESTYGLPRSWLSNMPEKIPEKARQARVPTSTELRIKGYARADRGDASCGPLIASF